MSKLLRFLVDHKLREASKPLTAYAVAVDGLGRDDGFDTQIDSYPRVQIGRLRRMLDHFYLREKSESRLSIPFHHYEIILGTNETEFDAGHLPAKSAPSGQESSPLLGEPDMAPRPEVKRIWAFSRGPVLAIVAALILLTAGTFYFLQDNDSGPAKETAITYPAVVIKAAEGIDNPSSRAQFEMIHSYLIGKLEKFDQMRIFDESADRGNLSQYYLETSILNDAADRVQLRLVASDTREVIWSSRIETTTPQEREADLDQAVINIAGSYGKIAQHELSKYRGDYTPGYPCLLQFHQYMRFRDPANLGSVLQCMKASAEQFSNDSYLMSMLAIAKNMAEISGVEDKIDGAGKEFALRAAKLDNNSASATFAVAQSAFYEGDCRRGASWGERAVGLNPLNSRIMGYLGMFMLACSMPEGEAYATRAMEMDDNVDLAVTATVAMQKLRRGDAKAAQKISSKYMDSVPGAAVGLEINYILSSAMLGEKEEARKAWRALAERSGFPETAEPRKVLGRWVVNPTILEDLVADFRKAQLY